MAAITVLVLVLFFPVIPSFPLLSLPVDGTACDWNVWDDTTEEKSVQKISVRCSNGRVVWRTPYGGLGITFLPPLKSEFYELCFIAESILATVQFFREGNQSLNHLALLSQEQPMLNHEICLNSSSDQPIVIFIETDSSGTSPVHGRVILDYDVRAIRSPAEGDQMQECSPCNDEDILLAACTADYAVVGQIHSISENNDSGMTDLHVMVSHVIRQQYKVVKNFLEDQNSDVKNTIWHQHLQSRYSPDHNSQSLKSMDSKKRNARISRESKSLNDQETLTNKYLPIMVPSKCHVRQGKGVFLFLGSIRLRRARLECAPRLEEFERMWNDAVTAGNTPCTL